MVLNSISSNYSYGFGSQSHTSVSRPVSTLQSGAHIDYAGAHEQLSSPRPVIAPSASVKTQADLNTKGKSDEAGLAPGTSGAASKEESLKNKQEKQELARDQRIISQLASRDREVRAHEQAHVAAGGPYAGAARYQYERGPDGVNYAIAGEVSIDTGRAANPQATIAKAQVIKRAALAPAEPSSQDRRVAAQARQMEIEARKQLVLENIEAAKQEEVQRNEDKSSGSVASDAGADVTRSDTRASSINNDSAPLATGRPENEAFSSISSRLDRVISNTNISSNLPGALFDLHI